MNTATQAINTRQVSRSDSLLPLRSLLISRLRDYSSIAKPRIALMVLVTVTVGYFLAGQGSFHVLGWLHASLGILVAATASSALNQFLERETDSRMARTKNRPLPSGRITPLKILLAGLIMTVSSTAYLYFLVNPLTAMLTLASILLYAGVYTPLKQKTAFCTAIGAIPGALPPVLGWTAAGGSLDMTAFGLFAIVFIWQFPHFLAIAWLYKEQYSSAGLRMLPADGRGHVTGWMALAYALCLIPVGLIPSSTGIAGPAAGFIAVIMGLLYAGAALNFLWKESRLSARQLVWISLVYLPTVFLAVTVEHWRLLS